MGHKPTVRIHDVVGIVCILAAFVIRPDTLENYVLLDQQLEHVQLVMICQILLGLFGLGLITWGRKKLARPSLSASRHARWKLVAGGAMSVTITLVTLEIVLRVFAHPTLYLDGDLYFEAHWRSTHNNRSDETERLYKYDEFDPELGWRPIANLNRDGIRTNSLGFRSDYEYQSERLEGISRIVIVGDSFTWGMQTSSGPDSNRQVYPAILDRMMPDTEVYNMGVSGWGTDQQFLALRRYGFRFRPDLVVLACFEHNIVRNGLSFFSYAKPRFVLVNGQLKLTPNNILAPAETLSRPFPYPRVRLWALFRKSYNALVDKTILRPFEERDEWKVTRAILSSMREECHVASTELLLVFIPQSVSLRSSAIERCVSGWANETGTSLLNTREVFASKPRTQWDSFYDGHWTSTAHAIVAMAIRDHILSERLLPESSFVTRSSVIAPIPRKPALR